MNQAPEHRLPILRLCCLTVAAVAIHGYHLGVEDGEIYIPEARKLLHPELYTYATEFFLTHGRLSLFSPILVCTARLTHLTMDWTVFLWYIASTFALLTSCWMLAAICFRSPRARWSSLLAMTAVLTMPATNTGLLLMDPYLTARSLTTPLTLWALRFYLRRSYLFCALTFFAIAGIHLQMAVYFLGFLGVLWIVEKDFSYAQMRVPRWAAGGALLITSGFSFAPAQGPYREALYARDFFFLSNWSWYHWVGMLAPLAILGWFWKRKPRGTTPAFQRLCLVLIPYGLLSILVAAIFSSSHDLDMFARLQPLRCFHLVTLVFILFLGGVLGENAVKGRLWLLTAVVLSLAGGMFVVARQTYPNSPQVELPWASSSRNPWMNALFWIRANTPREAVFAVDSRYFKEQIVDVHGFRSLSERASLADYYKDGGMVAMFPPLAVEWKQMSDATYGLNHFQAEDFTRLAGRYPVTWTIIHGPAPKGMDCPYQQDGYSVCRIPGAA